MVYEDTCLEIVMIVCILSPRIPILLITDIRISFRPLCSVGPGILVPDSVHCKMFYKFAYKLRLFQTSYYCRAKLARLQHD